MAKGVKTGGRKKGSLNKATVVKAKAIADSGLLPLDYMLGVMRDPQATSAARMDAAKSAAPYIHPRKQAIEHTGKDGGPMEFKDVTDEQLDATIARLEKHIAEAEGRKAPSANGSAATLSHQ